MFHPRSPVFTAFNKSADAERESRRMMRTGFARPSTVIFKAHRHEERSMPGQRYQSRKQMQDAAASGIRETNWLSHGEQREGDQGRNQTHVPFS